MIDPKHAKSETAKELQVSEAELDYIDDDLMKDFASAQSADGMEGGPEETTPSVAGRWGVYGNSVTYSGNLVYWKQNKKGTSNYGCGRAENWNAGKNWASYIIPKGTCSGGYQWYFIGNYRP